ncbi:MAG TPA: PDZ domain-containing protein [Nannocystaceae bacterium]|nr:PDZ domain-containing protein [Nannocystaceae bacterium]
MSAMIRRFVVAFACLAAVAPSAAALARPPRAPQPPAPPQAPDGPLPALAPIPPMPPVPPQPPAFVLAAHDAAQGRARLGVQVSSMTPELRKFLGAKEEAGILVQRVEDDSAAARAGIKVGDIVIVVDGDAIEGISEVGQALSDRKQGDEVDVVVVRKKKRRTMKVTLQEAEREPGFDGGGVQIHGLPGLSFDGGSKGEIEALRSTIEALESRLEALEKRSRRRATKP